MNFSHARAFLPAGLASAALFLLTAYAGLGFFFLFFPTMPLFILGLAGHARSAWRAGLIATIIIALLGGVPAAVLYLCFLALPACYLSRQALLSRGEPAQWFPMGVIMLHLMLFGLAAIAAMTLYYAGTEGGIGALIAEEARQEFSQANPSYAEILERVAMHWAFMIFGISLWMWALALYLLAAASNRLLGARAVRPNFMTRTFTMPNWVLSLLGIAALASLIGSEPLRFLGQTALVALFLPYFLLGCAWMHEASASWPNRRFFLIFTYVMIALLLWPILILAGAGLYQHIKRLSAPGNYTR